MTRKRVLYVMLCCILFLPLIHYLPAMATDQDWQEAARNYSGIAPQEWGQGVTGVITSFDPQGGKLLALTFDACGGGVKGSGYDEELIGLLRRERIPATLFINARWISANPEIFSDLASDPLFEIANHGLEHKPLSVSGMEAYGIKGTDNAMEAAWEIEGGAAAIYEVTRGRPLFFRSGTNHYDDVAVRIAGDLGHRVTGCSVNGDAGATNSADQVTRELLSANPGDIVLMHMNRPEGQTAEGVAAAIGVLKERGFSFVRLYEVLGE
ncbi:MAG TPA: polysaccharide deacetylase family protein [Synergistales bacterium]|nr:polysaccharide deacetylase family protein [Synergistales bacterium]HQO83502.1 polysaccharide deacetylase family protein [Synergistales bacterium]HQQ10750.1 polysaccharide deacetylase family protein [Synergistales bacterium]